MDSKTLETLGAKVTEVSASIKRSMWGEGMSVSGEFGASVSVPDKADPEEVMQALEAWLKERSRESLNGEFASVTQRAAPVAPPKATPVAAPTKAAEPEDNTEEFDLGDDVFLKHQISPSGKHFMKLFFGPFKTYGVTMWPEVISMYPELEGWETWAIGTDYQLPVVASKVVCEIQPRKTDPTKTTPSKVIALR